MSRDKGEFPDYYCFVHESVRGFESNVCEFWLIDQGSHFINCDIRPVLIRQFDWTKAEGVPK